MSSGSIHLSALLSKSEAVMGLKMLPVYSLWILIYHELKKCAKTFKEHSSFVIVQLCSLWGVSIMSMSPTGS